MDREPDATTEALRRARVWRQLARQAEQPRTAAQDSVLRLALGLWVFDARAGLVDKDRQAVLALLHDTEQRPMTTEERAGFKSPLLLYLKEYQARIYSIVEKQFKEC